jgi:hypothetical protein
MNVAMVSVSLGVRALPEVKQAIEHAAAHPDHDPVVFLSVTDDEYGQRVRWDCQTCEATDRPGAGCP